MCVLLRIFLLLQYTVISKVEDSKLVPYVTSIDTRVLIVLPGSLTRDEAFAAAHYENKLHAWGLRFIGWVLLFFAVSCSSDLITLTLSDLPLFSRLWLNQRQPLPGNIFLSISVAFFIIAMCWLIFRPWVGVAMLCAAVSPFVFCASRFSHEYQRVSLRAED